MNDELGHAAGDDVLVEVADRLRSVTRTSDTVARVGGDEFVIVIEEDDRSVDRLVRRIDEVMGEPMDINGQPITVTVSAGGSSDDSSATGIDELLASADAAMYRTKSRRRASPTRTR